MRPRYIAVAILDRTTEAAAAVLAELRYHAPPRQAVPVRHLAALALEER